MLINIDGWFGGGKSVLWSLLDGHKDVFVCPAHDYSFSVFLACQDNEEWLKKKNPAILRKILSKSEYYKFEKLYFDKAFPVCFSVDKFQYLPYSANFYEFDRQFFSVLETKDSWTIDVIISALYETYYRVYHQLEGDSPCPKYLATMSHPGYFKDYCNIPTILPHMKNILVKRGIKNIVATRVNRHERPKDLNGFQAFRTPFNTVIESGEIQKIVDYFEEYEVLAKAYPTQFLIMEFDDLVHAPAQSMQKVSNFLEIEYDSILSHPTRDGEILEYEGLSFIGKENDDYQQLLSKYQIASIDKIINHHSQGVTVENNTQNLDFSIALNKVQKFISQIINIKGNIVIYGDSVYGRYLKYALGDKVKFIIDQKVDKEVNEGELLHPQQINHHVIDMIIIAVLGREANIINYLTCELSFPIHQIRCLDLD